jgi:hypothetical protein
MGRMLLTNAAQPKCRHIIGNAFQHTSRVRVLTFEVQKSACYVWLLQVAAQKLCGRVIHKMEWLEAGEDAHAAEVEVGTPIPWSLSGPCSYC